MEFDQNIMLFHPFLAMSPGKISLKNIKNTKISIFFEFWLLEIISSVYCPEIVSKNIREHIENLCTLFLTSEHILLICIGYFDRILDIF